MTISRILSVALLAVVAGFIGLIAPEKLTTSGSHSLVTSAEAVVGRPLTPVSVAGAARRTARRCAAGVYNC